MEGLARLPLSEQSETDQSPEWRQRSLKCAIDCVGIGVHSGRRVTLTIRPAPADHGIVFRRTDLHRDIAARFENVVDTHLCTVLADPSDPAVRVGTVEHLLAALAGAGIDNALIELDGAEVPILDGSAAPFLFLLDCAGVVQLDAPSRVIEICRTVRVTAGNAWAEFRALGPTVRSAQPVLELDLSIDLPPLRSAASPVPCN